MGVRGIIRGTDSSVKGVKFLQLNLQHSKMAQITVGNWIDKQKDGLYICLCQEPYVYQNNALMQPRTSLKYIGGQGNHPRTAIYTSEAIKAWYIESLSHRDLTAIVVNINRRETLILSVYLDSKLKVIQPWLTAAMTFANSRGYAIIIGMDSNCHSELFGLETNKRGEQLEDFIGHYNLRVENQGKIPTFQSAIGRSIIDVTLSSKLSVSIKNWRVNTNPNFSDHNTIKYDLLVEQEDLPPTRKWIKMDWNDFRQTLKMDNIRIMDSMTSCRLEKCLEQWYTQVHNAIDKHCPKRKNKPKDKNNPWWTGKLQNQRKEIKQLKKQNAIWQTEERQAHLREKVRTYKRDCLKAKKQDWKDFNTKQNSTESINILRKILEKNKRNALGVLEKPDGSSTNPGYETLEYLMQAHFPSITPPQRVEHRDTKISTATINSTEIEGFDIGTLGEVIQTFKNKKASGPDELKPFVLKELPYNKLEELLFIYKTMILLQCTPPQWTKSKIIWIPKPGKDTYKVFKSWRPISLLNQPLKVMEKMIARQADKTMTKVHDKQHGFRRSKSTESAISETTNYIEKHMANNEDVIGVFLDIQAAFDTITPTSIKEALLKHNLDTRLVGWYYTFLTHRHLITEHNGIKYEGNIGIGFPQGGVCSAKFWIVAFNEAMNITNQFGALGIGFADDCCILLHRKHINHAMSLIQRIVDQLVAWGNTLGLTFNPTKTVCIQFTRATDKTIKVPRNKLRINGIEVPMSTGTRYLGVQLDSKLTWNAHFDVVVTKAKRYLCQLVGALSKYWGPQPKLVKWIYTAVVKPRLTYAALVWAQSIQTISKKQRLGQINRLAAMMLTPTRKNAPTAALEIIHDLIPLELALQETALNAYHRLKLMTQATWTNKRAKNVSLVPHLKFLKHTDIIATGARLDTETIMESIEDKNYWVTINSRKGRAKPIPSQINVYTDGSKTKQGSGAGYVIMSGKDRVLHTQSINLTENASIFQAELIAIKEAALYLQNNEDTQGVFIKFFSDSQAALQALKSNKCTAMTVKDTHTALNSLANQAKLVRLTWIKAHVGLDGNELADEYAKLGTIDDSTQLATQTTGKEIKGATREYVYHKWKEKWRALKKCRMTKVFYHGPDRRVGKVVARLSRTDMTLFIHAITGHNNLNYMNSIIIPGYTPLCRFCEEEDESFQHLYEDCPVFWKQRMEIQKDKIGADNWTVQSVIRMAKIEDIREAMQTNITEDKMKK